MSNTVLVTGGLGFIGSHTVVLLLEAGYEVVVVDNLYNSKAEVEQKILSLAPADAKLTVYHQDVCDLEAMDKIFAQHNFLATFHFAALKAVGESVAQPLRYYRENTVSVYNLLQLMESYKVNLFVQSSSATVYSGQSPFAEDDANPSRATCPYGQTKINIEYILKDVAAVSNIRSVILRYFNPVGAHPSGVIGEELTSFNNIFPVLSSVYLGDREKVTIFGDDYPTKDGTCERDYIHVMDLARGHLVALDYMLKHPELNCEVFNLGNGEPISVKDIVEMFNTYGDRPVKYDMGARRPGDAPVSYADITKASQTLGFKCEKTKADMVRDTINFLKRNYIK